MKDEKEGAGKIFNDWSMDPVGLPFSIKACPDLSGGKKRKTYARV